MNTAPHFATGTDTWETPQELFDTLHSEFNCELDVAASDDNAKLPLYLTSDMDALGMDWHALAKVCWMNPPYSKGLQVRFIEKAVAEAKNGVTTVALLPARTDTRMYHQYIWDETRQQPREGVEVRFLKGRLKFSGAKAAAPFPSMVVIFRGRS